MMGNVGQSYMQWHFPALQSVLSVALTVCSQSCRETQGFSLQYSTFLQEYGHQPWTPVTPFILLDVQGIWDGVLWSWGEGVLMENHCLGREAGVIISADGDSLPDWGDVRGGGRTGSRKALTPYFPQTQNNLCFSQSSLWCFAVVGPKQQFPRNETGQCSTACWVLLSLLMLLSAGASREAVAPLLLCSSCIVSMGKVISPVVKQGDSELF